MSHFSGIPDYITKTVETVMKLHQSEPVGDILAFLTGQDEVRFIELLRFFYLNGLDVAYFLMSLLG